MRKRLLGASPVALAIALVVALSSPASAATPQSKLIVGAGSDTTYVMMQKLDDLYNGSVGCVVIGTPQVFNGKCAYPDTPDTVLTENYEHDRAVELYPLGSSNGILQLSNVGTTGYTTINFARSSRGPRNTDLAGLQFIAYARDGISWWSANANTHAPANLSQADINGIWNTCTDTTWGDVNGQGGADTTPILVYAAQVGSGTRTTFDGFLGTGANSTNCIPASQKDGNATNGERVIFENNAQPIFDQNEQSSAIFYYSFGRFQQNSIDNGRSSLGKVDGVAPTTTTIENGTFPYGRFLYNVIRNSTAKQKANAATRAYLGAKTGWLCKNSTLHSKDPATGNNYRTDIEDVISGEGFVPLTFGTIGGGVTGSSFCRVTPIPT